MTLFVIVLATCSLSFSKPLSCDINIGDKYYTTREECKAALKSKQHKCVAIRAELKK